MTGRASAPEPWDSRALPRGRAWGARRAIFVATIAAYLALGCSSERTPSTQDNPCAPGRVGPTHLPDDEVTACRCDDAAVSHLTYRKGAALCLCVPDAADGDATP